MATKHVVDAHALIWYLEDNPKLGTSACRILDDSASELIVPTIALAEACWVIEKGRCGIPTVAELLNDVQADPRMVFAALDMEIVNIAAGLTPLEEMHDRHIVATVLQLSHAGQTAALVSKDENIRASGLVTIVW